MFDDASELEKAADRAAAAGDMASAVRILEQLVQSDGTRPLAWIKLSAMRRARGDFQGALEAVERALTLDALDFNALLGRAFLLERLGDARAGEAFSIAVAQAPDEERLPAAIRSALEQARHKSQEHRRRVERQLIGAIDAGLPPEVRTRLERFASNAARLSRHYHQEPTHFHYPGLPEIEVHDRSHFPELAVLESATDDIQKELEALLAGRAGELVPYSQYPEGVPLRQWEKLNNSLDWTAIHLLQNGQRVEANASQCPRTMEALAELPQPRIAGASPNAMFSLLAPKTKIPPHTGVANTRLVCHLPLIVPPNCGFRVGARTLEWQRGKAFVFDDTIEHEAWNDSDQLRVVVILDLWPPALGQVERRAVASMISAAGVSFTGGL